MGIQRSKKKCNCCGKEMTDAEYINYLENELAKAQEELATKKNVNIPWFDPNAYPYKWVGWPQTSSWNTNKHYDIMQPTGDMCSTSCRMDGLDKNGGCLMCGRMQPPMGTGLL